MKILVTGGAGFIGSAVCRHLIAGDRPLAWSIVDKLTYAAQPRLARADRRRAALSLRPGRHLRPRRASPSSCASDEIDAVMHLAAESHVDRSIDGPAAFIETNIVGTFTLLEAARAYWRASSCAAGAQALPLPPHLDRRGVRRSAASTAASSPRTTPYAPSSPYSASKAVVRPSGARLARDLRPAGRALATAPTTTDPIISPRSSSRWSSSTRSRTSRMPRLRHGRQRARLALCRGSCPRARHWSRPRGEPAESYNIGGGAERTNLAVVETICDLLDARSPPPGKPQPRA